MTKNLAKNFLGVFILLVGVTPSDAGMSHDPSGGMALEAQPIPFLNGLRKGYVDLSQTRAGAKDWIDAERFARKARHAASRVSAHPDAIMDRDLHAADAAELDAALSRLRDSYDLGGRHLTPMRAAKAQVAYDCWIEAAEAHRTADMAPCKQAFSLAMTAVEQVVIAWPSQSVPTIPASVPSQQAKAAPKSVVVHFSFDSAELSATGWRAISAALAKAKVEPSGILSLKVTGHTDSIGSETYNRDLSLRRAQAVRDTLLARGSISSGIAVIGRGEAEPAVPTADGAREPANRRVEIVFLYSAARQLVQNQPAPSLDELE